MLRHIPFYAFLLNKKINNKKPTHSQVLVYGAIEAHSLGPKGCIASNSTLATETGLGGETVSNIITQLSDAKWVKVTMKNSRNRAFIVPLWNGTLEDVPLTDGIVPLDNGTYYIENTEREQLDDKKEITSMILYFYSKLMPAEQTGRRFAKANYKDMGAMLSTYGEKDVRETIDKAKDLLGKSYKPQVQSVQTLLAKYEQIKAEQQIIKHQPTKSF